MEEEITVKILLKKNKQILLFRACELRLVGVKHTKIELARAIARKESEIEEVNWKIISNI